MVFIVWLAEKKTLGEIISMRTAEKKKDCLAVGDILNME